jgi:beta-lactamase superfamily II metal-dependent hydrolase
MTATKNIRVRMYRVGFGDCFLVSFTEGSKKKHILIDCGVHTQSQYKNIDGAVAAIQKETGGKLAAVVATHAHADHISGFGTEAETFQQFEVGHVWMPWLEDLSNPKAKKLQTKTAALAAMLEAHLALAGATADPLVEMITLNAVGRSSKGNNAKALDLLRGGFGDKSRTKYLKAGDVLSDAAGIKGLSVRVLAPSDDATFLSKMKPPEAQLYGLNADGEASIDTVQPFAARWTDPNAMLDPAYQQKLDTEAAVPLQGLALAVDHYLNNTSLSLLLQYKGKTLLFPGDAQWGNWLSWHDDWSKILGDIDFYKVGHHGSHNATPHEALDLMTDKAVVAMVSTDTVTSFNKGNFPVPYAKLVRAVKKQVGDRYAQSDDWKKAKAPFKTTADWCDYEL